MIKKEAEGMPADAGGGTKETRTEYAAERTVLANERTYAAWVRTGLAALVSGLAVMRFMEEILPSWALLAVAGTLILFGVFSFAAGAWRYTHIGRRLRDSEVPQLRPSLVIGTTGLLAAAACVALTSLLVLK